MGKSIIVHRSCGLCHRDVMIGKLLICSTPEPEDVWCVECSLKYPDLRPHKGFVPAIEHLPTPTQVLECQP